MFRLRNTLLIPAVAIAILPLPYFHNTMDPALVPRFTFLAACTLCMTLVFLIKKQPLLIPRWPAAALAVFLLSGLISSPGVSAPSEILFSLGKDVLMSIFFILLFSMLVPLKIHRHWLLKALLLMGLFAALPGWYELAMAYLKDGASLDTYQLTGTLGHRNLLASGVLLALPFAVYGSWHFHKFWRLLSFLTALASLLLIVFLQSRTSLLALVVFAGGYFFLWLWRWKGRPPLVHHLRTILLYTGLLLALGFCYFYFFKKPFPRQQELKTNISLGEGSDQNFTAQERLLMWKATAAMVFDQPFGGAGPGQWKILFPAYGSDIWRTRQGMVQFQRPHNDFIWILAEQGLIGLLAYLSLFALAFLAGLKILVNPVGSPRQKDLAQLLLAALGAYLSIAFFSFPRERIVHQVVLFSIVALIFSAAENLTGKSNLLSLKKRWSAGIAVLFLIPILLMGWYRWQGEVQTVAILKARQKSDWQGMLKAFHPIKNSVFYTIDPTSVPMDFYTGLAYLNLDEYEQAEIHFKKAYKIHPNNIHVINNLANTYQLKGELDQAIPYYQKALTVAPHYQDGRLNLAAAYFNNNQLKEAYKVLALSEKEFEAGHSAYTNYLHSVLSTLRHNLADTMENENAKNKLLNLSKEELMQMHQLAKPDPDGYLKKLNHVARTD